jgi:molecular chaperone GrpE (heat shock protein)
LPADSEPTDFHEARPPAEPSPDDRELSAEGEPSEDDAERPYSDDEAASSEAPLGIEGPHRRAGAPETEGVSEHESEEAVVFGALPSEDTDADLDLSAGLRQILDQLVLLQRDFEGKLKYDAHKDKVIDRLHDELQEYKQDLLKKHLLTVILDVIKIADDIRKWLHHFRALEPAQRDPLKLFRYLEAIPTDLEDVFYWHGVKPFASTEGAFDPARQRVAKKVPTTDPSKDKTVARSLRPGYIWDDKVIRQEMVAVYVHDDGSQLETTRNDND